MLLATMSGTPESPGGGGGGGGGAGRGTGGWFGVDPMVAVVVAGALEAPRLSVTTRATVKLPVAAYAWAGVAPLPLAPSPKVQAYVSGTFPSGSEDVLPLK